MTIFNKQGVLMERWFKTPNAMVDDITGDLISTQAAAILTSILRLTEGMNGREWAQIPHSFFMRKTQAKRRETIAKYIKELVDQKLIKTERVLGKVTSYAINWACNLWYSVAEVKAKNNQSVQVRYKRTCTLEPYNHVRLIRTGQLKTCTFHPYTYKDKPTKDNIKEKNIETPIVEKPKTLSKKQQADLDRKTLVNSLFAKWLELSGQKITASEKRLSHINARLDKFSADDIIEAMTYVATDSWHVEQGYNKIELAVRSVEQLENKLIAARAAAKKPALNKPQSTYNRSSQTRATDPLAVNAKWGDDQPMTDEEKRAWAGTPIPFCSDSDSDDQSNFDFNDSQGVMEI